jgi:hypothetical protein
MPRVLRKLRIDEISAVDGAANSGAKILIYKRDDERRSFYHRLFAGEIVRKATYRGGSGSRLHHIENLTREEAMHWLAYDPNGRSFARERGEPLDTLADHLVEASGMNVNNHHKEKSMNKQFDVVSFAKRVADDGLSVVSEAQATELIKQYCDANRLPGEKSSAAFARVFSGNDDVGLNFRKMVQIAKGIAHPHVGPRAT